MDGEYPSKRPYVTVSGFAYDDNLNFPILYRSDKVRSAKNCWSLPSGLHEIGMRMEDQFCTELQEELNLNPIASSALHVGVYENIAACDGFHWVIHIFVVRVKSLATLINKEPDKHSRIMFKNVDALYEDPTLGLEWSPGLGDALKKYGVTAANLAHR